MNQNIKIIGVGGSGSNTVSRIARRRQSFSGQTNLARVELIAVNTDGQALFFSKADKKILIGKDITGGLGTGMNAGLGKRAAEESIKEIKEVLRGGSAGTFTDMVFITCGLGGGTGSGAAPVIAEISKELGILTVVIVTTPFSFEGLERKKLAERALEDLKEKTDSILVISNNNLLKVVDEKTTVSGAFSICDEVLGQAVSAITDLILVPGIINIDFASIVSIMKDSGKTLFGTGKALGENRAIKAAELAINSPLLDFSINGAKAVLFSVAGNDVTLNEIQEVAKIITQHVDSRAQISFGAVKPRSRGNSEFSELKKGEIKVTVIATKLA